MNTYSKFVPNVFLAKCSESHEKGETIQVVTKHGKENECIVFNLILEKDGFYFYSIVRADGFNVQEWAKRKADMLQNAAIKADCKSDQFYKKSHSITDNIPDGQPILVGHHSENRHRRDLAKSWSAMGKSVELSDKADEYKNRAEYWEKRAHIINLSMPESLEYFEFLLEKAKAHHEGLKNGTIVRDHGFSLTYAKKEVNEIQMKLKFAQRLWA
jgi:hypothetical protein